MSAVLDIDSPIPYVLTDRGLAALTRARKPDEKTYLTSLGDAVLSARAAHDASKQTSGRGRGKKGKTKYTGDAYFLGIVAGLLEARMIYHRCNEALPTARVTGAGMLCRGK